MKNYFKLFFLLKTALVLGQFNTITYPIERKKEKDYLHQSFSVSQKKDEEKKLVPKLKQTKRTTKQSLKKELDSLKSIIVDFSKKEDSKRLNIKRIEDSLLQSFQRKINTQKDTKHTYLPIKKYDLVREDIIKKIAMPLDKMQVTSPFGFRSHPIFGGKKMHNGIDLNANFENVYAVLEGVITEAGWDNKGGGNYIKIRHSNRFETSYLHLSEIYYRVGEIVKAGYIIGKSGNSGNSTGPHLHFGVKEFGKFINPIKFINNLIKVNNLISIHYEQFANQ
ncbi:M23 family metallopeptidase [Riemerella anatipestifer]|uniref:M23 family metallopeptidase n=1 Tax=Riemerella anatipestifer TaxID=34085 RepID=UPI0009BB81A7|nr:M23 family metallopeptidase [Riemerella anatipestifer]MDR7693390.1 M23 family metallopeptidase [Riemerella anatipestifer]MDY3528869.1 M23 family metallopeptidase [Riemerella anatipestifer]MDY3538084.1 M23 family metallopeptidase [Riemerella anatipestifer]